MTGRAENRKFHFTYKVICTYNGRIFYGVHSADDLDQQFTGAGSALSLSVRNHGKAQHYFQQLQLYLTRAEAKAAYNELKASQLVSPKQPEDRKYHFVYRTTRLDGKYYIGVHSTDSLDDGYLGSGTHIGRSIKKHGKENHTREILELCDSRAAAFELEKKLVTNETLKDPLCMNKAAGGAHHGQRPYGFSAESRLRISEASKRQWTQRLERGWKPPPQSVETIAKRTAKLIGKRRTPEQVRTVQKRVREYYANADLDELKLRGQKAAKTRVENGTNKGGRPPGIPMSDEQKARQSAATKGKKLSDTHRLNLRKPKTRVSCLFCKADTTISHLPRYHNGCLNMQ
jgi:hypothetical protein